MPGNPTTDGHPCRQTNAIVHDRGRRRPVDHKSTTLSSHSLSGCLIREGTWLRRENAPKLVTSRKMFYVSAVWTQQQSALIPIAKLLATPLNNGPPCTSTSLLIYILGKTSRQTRISRKKIKNLKVINLQLAVSNGRFKAAGFGCSMEVEKSET